jgi:hypothetical protein
MSASLLGKRFAHREGKPGWHRLANKVWAATQKILPSEAMEEVAGGIVIFAKKIHWIDDQGVQQPIPNRQAVLRGPVPEDDKVALMGITADAWKFPGYHVLAKAVDGLVDGTGLRVATAGVLLDGRRAFICFEGDPYDVRGDEIKDYSSMLISAEPGRSHEWINSPVRTECVNTETRGRDTASVMFRIPHTYDAPQRLALVGNLSVKAREMRDKAKATFEAFADFAITGKEAEAIFAAAYPDPSMPAQVSLLKERLNEAEAETFKANLTHDLLQSLLVAEERYQKACEHAKKVRDSYMECYEGFEPVKLRGTAWAAYNGVTESADWRNGRNVDESMMIGTRSQEKARAFAECVKVVAA